MLKRPSLSRAGSPELLRHPRHVLHLQRHAVVGHHRTAADRLQRQHVLVGHVVLVTMVVECNVPFAVVRGVDLDLALEDVRRRVGRADVGY